MKTPQTRTVTSVEKTTAFGQNRNVYITNWEKCCQFLEGRWGKGLRYIGLNFGVFS